MRSLYSSLIIILSALAFNLSSQAFASDPATASGVDYVFYEAPGDHTLGADEAPNTLIIYASNMCPHCRDWFVDEWPSVKSDLVETDKVRVVFRPLPSAPTQLSMIGFMIAECGGAENYFANIEHQFDRQSTIHEKMQAGGLREEYAGIAAKAGLADEEAMNICLTDETKLAKIHAAGARANAADINSIPGFILNGKVLNGQQTAVTLAAALHP
jgi:protein-disulfide isomerase